MRATVVLLLALFAAPAAVWADEAPPTQADLAAAKRAFEEADALYRVGKLVDALAKLEESYRLSRNPMLLYNLGLTSDQAGQRDAALRYYRQFLATAPANAPKRDAVKQRIEALEKEPAAPTEPEQVPAATPAGKYSQAEFKHEVVFTAPQHKPLDIRATVPKDSGWTLTLFYRGSNDATFTKEPMAWREQELFATIPGNKLVGAWIQYYIEVRDSAGALVARSGKSTSPNLIGFEGGVAQVTEEDPLESSLRVVAARNETPAKPLDPMTIVKWSATGASLGLVATSIWMFTLAQQQHDKLVADANACGGPPCRAFDAEYDRKVEKLGMHYDLAYKLTLGFGVATAGLAGYLWYRDLRHKPEAATAARGVTKRMWAVAPALGDGHVGAVAAARF